MLEYLSFWLCYCIIWSFQWPSFPLVVNYLGPDGSLQHDSLCFISDDSNHYTSFLYQVQTILVDYLKANHPNIKKLNYFSNGCGGQYKNYQNFMDLCSHKHDVGIIAELMIFATNFSKSPFDGNGGAGKQHEGKRSLQRSLNNQILKLGSAIFYQIFIFSSNDSPLKTMKIVFYFISKALFVLEIFKLLWFFPLLSTLPRFKRANGSRIIYDVMKWLA